MARFRLFIEYEGTRYSGWQIQKNARTVQGELTDALRTILQTADFELYGAGRTDAGVHALRQVAHLEARTMLAPEILRMKVNDLLPPDINVLEVEKADPRFHARHHAVARSYLYEISRRRTAFGKRFVWWIKDPIDVRRMRETARLFVGMKDLRSFTESDPEETSTKVHIEEIEVAEQGALILIRVVGSHFLWKLVRRIIGVMVEVGRGKLTAETVRQYLTAHTEAPARLTAPPSGLFLERVYYEGEERLKEMKPVIGIDAWKRSTQETGSKSQIPSTKAQTNSKNQ